MMTADQLKDGLRTAAFLLSYPDAAWRAGLDEAEAAAGALEGQPAAQLAAFVAAARAADAQEFEKRYVDAFDFNKDTSLYLTSRDRGDDAQRRTDMLAYSVFFTEAGYTPEGESPDYLPAVLELAAEAAPEVAARMIRTTASDVASLAAALEAHELSDYAQVVGAAIALAGAYEKEAVLA